MAMDKQELQDRISKVDQKIEKINKRIAKWSKGMCDEAHELCKKALLKRDDPNYESNYREYRAFMTSHRDDPTVKNQEDSYSKGPNMMELWTAYSDLRDILVTKQKYEDKLAEVNNFENEDKIQVLVDFLDAWEEQAREFYLNNAKEYFDLSCSYKDAEKEYLEKLSSQELNPRLQYRYVSDFSDKYFSDITTLTKDITYIKKKYIYPNPNDKYYYEYIPDSYSVDEEKLNKILKDEKTAKYKDLVARISSVVGNIQDVSNLHIAPTGQLNGVVMGDRGNAHVETIGAGGWNVQIFHYRTLVHKIK